MRQEHPNPQYKRAAWRNLNGTWEFEFDFGASGKERRMYENGTFTKTIEVPFCPESSLSGIGYKDFMAAVWYRRSFALTEGELGGRVLLHFGAVDYHSYIYINGALAGTHKGGYSSFAVDITDYCKVGDNTVVVCAEDDTRDRMIPCGKQSKQFYSAGCDYTRTTGIWQTVWLEFVPNERITTFRLFPDAQNGSLRVEAKTIGTGLLRAEAFYEGKPVGVAEKAVVGQTCDLEISLSEQHLWEVGCGRLYDLVLTFGDDRVESYFGLRDIRYENKKFYLNGKSVFQRLVLDQGFYPDGIYTAPSEEALIKDIEISMAVGFNGARLHEKIFEPLFLYHADRLGYLVWGEYPNWGLDHSYAECIYGILPEWLEEIERDFNHPAIIGWCPFNETWDQKGRKQFDDALVLVYHATKAADPTRPCIDTSGNYHVVTDVYDVHDYLQDPLQFAEHFSDYNEFGTMSNNIGKRQHYDGKLPFFVSEYGGIRWSEDPSGWGYGNAPKTEEEFKARFKGLTDVLLDDERIFALCYTQLYDIEQEQNGLYTYDRRPKFKDMQPLYDAMARKAAIED
jgi:beta-galactosidase/beta-glucuronidase